MFVFGFGYGRWYSTRPAGAKDGRKILYYVDPMHPWYKSDKPGIAPDCGMKLEPVYAGGAPGPIAPPFNAATPPATEEGPVAEGAIQISPEKQQLMGMRLRARPNGRPEARPLRVAGRVVADETRVTPRARQGGRLDRTRIRRFHRRSGPEGPAAADALQPRAAGQPAGVAAGAARPAT